MKCFVSGDKCKEQCLRLIKRGNASDSSFETLIAVTRQYHFKYYHAVQSTKIMQGFIFDDWKLKSRSFGFL